MCGYSVYSFQLFIISSAFVRSVPFLAFIVPIFALNVPLLSLIFLKNSSFPFYCFPLFLFIVHLKDLLISPCYSLELCIQMACHRVRGTDYDSPGRPGVLA